MNLFRTILLFSCLQLCWSCQSTTQESLDGIWSLNQYFDTIDVNRKIAPHFYMYPTQFGSLLEVRGDTLYTYGWLINQALPFNRESDTLVTFKDWDEGKWHVLREKKQLHLVQDSSSEYRDSTLYTYRKRADLPFADNQIPEDFKVEEFLAAFFEAKFLQGIYIDQLSGKEVIFGKDGTVSGIGPFTHYQINDFSSRTQIFDLLEYDGVVLSNGESRTYYNWEWVGDTLKLVNFVPESYISNGEVRISEMYYHFGEDRWALTRKNE